MKHFRTAGWVIFLIVFAVSANSALAKKRRSRRVSGPPLTHPVVLWSRTLSQSSDLEQKRVAAFKLSQYSVQITQPEEVITTLLKCIKDPDEQVKVLCTKAMSKVGKASHTEMIRKALLEQYSQDPAIRNTVVRTFINRRDASPVVQETFLKTLSPTSHSEDLLVHLSYFESYGTGSENFVSTLADLYKNVSNTKVKMALVKVLGERGQGQSAAIDLLAQCTESRDTPLVLTCLSGLQQQAKKDSRAWAAVSKTIYNSSDPDVLLATLDVINALTEPPKGEEVMAKLSRRLIEVIGDADDSDVQEKAVLALGVCGDQSPSVVTALQNLLEDTDAGEGARIATALTLAKQSVKSPLTSKTTLQKCIETGKTVSLKNACQLGLDELNGMKSTAVAEALEKERAAMAEKTAKAEKEKAATASTVEKSKEKSTETSKEKAEQKAENTPSGSEEREISGSENP